MHEIEGLGGASVEIPDPLAKAETIATLARQEMRNGTAEPLGAHVKFEDHPGPDKGATAWKTSATLNRLGAGNCNSVTKAAIHGIEAPDGTVQSTNPSHVAVVDVPQPPGAPPVQHAFLVKEAGPGDPPLNIDGAGKVVGDLPAHRIVDPNVAKGAEPLPLALYQGASVAPIHPAHLPDLSHLAAPPAQRAAEGMAHQGDPRDHAPQTPAGVKVAEVAHLAARMVTPHPDAVPVPLPELYPTHHPVIDETGRILVRVEAPLKRALGLSPKLALVQARQLHDGLEAIGKGVNPAPIPGDPAITPAHREAANGLREHLLDLAGAQHPTGPDAESVAALAAHAASLRDGDRDEPAHDVAATQTSEIKALLPAAVPEVLAQHLPRPIDPAAAPPSSDRRGGARLLPRLDRALDGDEIPLYIDGDREEDLGVDGSALWGPLSDALDSWACGHPGDGRRRAPPLHIVPRHCGGCLFGDDPRLGDSHLAQELAAKAAVGLAPIGATNLQDVGAAKAQGWRPAPPGAVDERRRALGGGQGWNAGLPGRDGHGRRDERREAPAFQMLREWRPEWGTEGRGAEFATGRIVKDARLHTSPIRGSRWTRVLSPGEEVRILGAEGEAVHVGGRGWHGWVGAAKVRREAGDARLGAWGDWRRGVYDRSFVDQIRFRRAYAAATTSAYVVRRLLAGGTIHGYDLPNLQAGAAQRGLALPAALAPSDPALGGPGHWGGGGGGRWRGGGGYGGGWGGPAYVQPVYAPRCVDPTDPSDPCYDPSLGGTGGTTATAPVEAPAAAAAGGPGRLLSLPATAAAAEEPGVDLAAAFREAFAGRAPAGCTTGCGGGPA